MILFTDWFGVLTSPDSPELLICRAKYLLDTRGHPHRCSFLPRYCKINVHNKHILFKERKHYSKYAWLFHYLLLSRNCWLDHSDAAQVRRWGACLGVHHPGVILTTLKLGTKTHKLWQAPGPPALPFLVYYMISKFKFVSGYQTICVLVCTCLNLLFMSFFWAL